MYVKYCNIQKLLRHKEHDFLQVCLVILKVVIIKRIMYDLLQFQNSVIFSVIYKIMLRSSYFMYEGHLGNDL